MQHKTVIDPKAQLSGWTVTEPFRDKLVIMGVDIYISGMQAHHPKLGEVVGAAGNAGSHPDNRAWFELIERISILETIHRAPTRLVLRDPLNGASVGLIPFKTVFPAKGGSESFPFQFARSNGVALDRRWREACRRAAYELIERHLVLLSWAGKLKPETLSNGSAESVLDRFTRQYEIRRIGFGFQKTNLLPGPIYSRGAFLIPKTPEVPFVYGLGADESPEGALKKAEAEAVQRLGFLWGEDIPSSSPAYSPSALYHQEFYLHPEKRGLILNWLDGGHVQKDGHDFENVMTLSFADLTAPSAGAFQIARAYSPDAVPLVFGRWKEGVFKDLREDLLIHPVA